MFLLTEVLRNTLLVGYAMARRARLNKLKKASTTPRKMQFDEDKPPSEATWATMTPYGSFIGVYLLSLVCSKSQSSLHRKCNKLRMTMGRNICFPKKICMSPLSLDSRGPGVRRLTALV